MVGCLLGGVLGALIYIGLIEMHHDSVSDGVTRYELESIITSTPESKTRGSEIGKGNMAFDGGIPTNDN